MLILAVALALAPNSNWLRKLPDGTSVNFVAVSNFYAKKSWAPDGKAQKSWMIPDSLKQFLTPTPAKALSPFTNFVVQITSKDASVMPSVAFKVGKDMLAYNYTLRDLKNMKMWWSGAGIETKKLGASATVQVGVGTGAWKSTATHDMQVGGGQGPKFFGNVLRDVKYGNANTVVLEATIPRTVYGKMAYKIKLYDVNGQSLTPAGVGPYHPGVNSRFFFVENGKRLVRAELLTQPYRWLSFSGVHVKSK